MTSRPSVTSRAMVFLALATLGLTGCSLWSDDDECESLEEYQSAQAAAELSVPSGLDRPDPTARLDVPDEPVADEPLSKNSACLQRPPPYFDKPPTKPEN